MTLAVPITLITAIELVGVFANALLGAAVARRHRLDPIGFIVLAVVSALGGGLIRDVCLQVGTPLALADWRYLATAFVAAGVAFLIRFEGPRWERIYPFVDAVGLGLWAASGASKALEHHIHTLPALCLGLVTAVGGGAVREVLVGERPSILSGQSMYATSALVASLVVALLHSPFPRADTTGGAIAGTAFVLLARWRRWGLPTQVRLPIDHVVGQADHLSGEQKREAIREGAREDEANDRDDRG